MGARWYGHLLLDSVCYGVAYRDFNIRSFKLIAKHSDLAPLLVDRLGAARLLGVSAPTIDNLQRRGELPSVKIGSRRLFEIAAVKKYIDSLKAGAI